ncbi:major facilitator superfamily domain-containing protein [Hyaloraphidium curvatum]|nr:major facilitator superfamily domain-containing protein [Hyaloraphidium curvatum]
MATNGAAVLQNGAKVDAVAANGGGKAEDMDANLDILSVPAAEDAEGAGMDGGYGWVIVAASAACNFLCYGVMQSFGLWIGYYLTFTFAGSSAAQVSLTSSLQGGCSFLFGPFVGRITDRFGPRLTCLIGVTLQVAANVAASFSLSSIYAIWVTQGILFGTGSCFVSNAAMSAPPMWFRKKLSLAFGVAVMFGGLGGLSFTFMTQALLTNLGPAWTLRVYAAINAALLYPAAFALRNHPGRGAWDPSKPRPFLNIRIFSNKKFLLFMCGIFCCGLAFPAAFYLPSYLYYAGMDPNLGAPLLAVSMGLSGIAATISGTLAPRTGVLNLFIGSQAVAAASVFAFWLPAGSSVAMLFLYAAIWGLFWGPVWNLLAGVVGRLFADLDAFPVVIGSTYVALSFSMFCNAPIFGALIDAGTASGAGFLYAQIWAGGIYFLGLSLVMALRMWETGGKLFVKI